MPLRYKIHIGAPNTKRLVIASPSKLHDPFKADDILNGTSTGAGLLKRFESWAERPKSANAVVIIKAWLHEMHNMQAEVAIRKGELKRTAEQEELLRERREKEQKKREILSKLTKETDQEEEEADQEEEEAEQEQEEAEPEKKKKRESD